MCFDASHSHEIIAYPVLLTSSRWSSGAPTDNGSSHSGRLVVRRGDTLELGEVNVDEVNAPGRDGLLELGEANVPGRVDLLELGVVNVNASRGERTPARGCSARSQWTAKRWWVAACGTPVMNAEKEVGPCCAT